MLGRELKWQMPDALELAECLLRDVRERTPGIKAHDLHATLVLLDGSEGPAAYLLTDRLFSAQWKFSTSIIFWFKWSCCE
jgi:hypothetical protein